MPTYKYTGTPSYRSRPTGDLVKGQTATVPKEFTDHFDDHDDFVRLAVEEDAGDADGDDDSAAESGGSDGEDALADAVQDDFTDLEGVGPARADDLHDDGYDTYDDLREASPEDIAETDGVTETNAESWHDELAENESE